MTESSADLAQRLQGTMQSLDRLVEGFRGVRIDRENDRLSMVFRWFDDPNVYEFCSAADGGPWAWDATDPFGMDLMEELETGFLLRATKTRHGQVLRIDLDTGKLRETGDDGFYLSKVLEYVGHLAAVGLDTAPGLAARRAGTLLGWTSAAVNSATGGPALAQIVTVRDTSEEAQIAHLQLTDQARALVGYELVFSAIHQAARHGIHRLYSSRTIAHIGPFGFTAATDRPEMVVYDITIQDMNWPEQLAPSVAP